MSTDIKDIEYEITIRRLTYKENSNQVERNERIYEQAVVNLDLARVIAVINKLALPSETRGF
jgi:hypothetical protein